MKKLRLSETSNLNLSKWLQETEIESLKSNKDLKFALEIFGSEFSKDLDFSPNSLQEIETKYRFIHQNLDKNDRDLLERLIALYLGQVLVRNKQAYWEIYEGKYHTLSPITININKKNLDVFGFCQNLTTNKNLKGAKSNNSLLFFYEKAESLSF